jgi:quercetin dioxygenase-like cupin family protein|tara:strand:+ start:1932 stop:2321 length:390 start_codon:yes stop_codon:yes gene_type:complete
MIIHQIKIAHQDERGAISDILQQVDIDCVTLITITKGSIRGNHYHKDSIQYSYVLSGEVIVYTQMPNQKVEKCILKPGDMLESPIMERHSIHGVDDNSSLLILTKGPRGGGQYEEDTFRVSQLHENFNS